MTMYSSGVNGPARPSFGARADCYDCEVSGPSATTCAWSVYIARDWEWSSGNTLVL